MVHLASVASIAALLASVQALEFTFENKCSYAINLYDNSNIQDIKAGASVVRSIEAGTHGMFRHGKGDQATLAEYSLAGGRVWFDISVVPPGPGNCNSHANCKAKTGKTGYNVPMSIIPNTQKTDETCRTLTCESEDCADAYLYPSDDLKTHSCVDSVPIKVVFCPNGGSSSASTSNENGTIVSTKTNNSTTTATPTTASNSASTTASNTGTTSFKQATSYESGTVTTGQDTSDSGNSKTISDASTSVSSSFTYSNKQAGNWAGSYNAIVSPASCSKQSVTVNSPVGPLSEEVTMVFRGPMNIYNIAVFDGSSGGDWKLVSSYASTGSTKDMVFMNNKNIDYSGSNKSPQGYASADGLTSVSSSTKFSGWLAEASNPSNTYGGPGIATGAEVNIMRESKCSDDKNCKGYYDENGHHGWSGGKKMFVTKVKMPAGSTPNQPAVWMLNAQVVRSNQYQCNCRGSGGVGGCGELDIAEVIETNAARDKVSTHYYFYDGSVPAGKDNFAPRPSSSATTYLTIIDDSGNGNIKILEIGENDFDFSASSVANSQIKKWLSSSS